MDDQAVQGGALRIQCLGTTQDYSTSRKVVLSRSRQVPRPNDAAGIAAMEIDDA